MTDVEAAARGVRAQAALNEFVAPVLDNMRQAYLDRIMAVATNELDAKARADKIAVLSVAMKVVDNLTQGIDVAIRDGEIAEKSLLTVERIETMSEPKRRLFSMAPHR